MSERLRRHGVVDFIASRLKTELVVGRGDVVELVAQSDTGGRLELVVDVPAGAVLIGAVVKRPGVERAGSVLE